MLKRVNIGNCGADGGSGEKRRLGEEEPPPTGRTLAQGLGVGKAQARGPAACMTCKLGRDKQTQVRTTKAAGLRVKHRYDYYFTKQVKWEECVSSRLVAECK